MTYFRKRIYSVFVLLLAGSTIAQAAIVFNYNSGTNQLTIDIDTPITFEMTSSFSQSELRVILPDVYASDEFGFSLGSASSTLTLNGGNLVGFQNLDSGNTTGRDLVMIFASSGSLSPGDQITLSSGSVTSSAGSPPNIVFEPDFPVNEASLFLANFGGGDIGGVVPEPGLTSLILSGIFGVVVVYRRRRRSS